MTDTSSKVAIVTGSSRGIGAAEAAALPGERLRAGRSNFARQPPRAGPTM